MNSRFVVDVPYYRNVGITRSHTRVYCDTWEGVGNAIKYIIKDLGDDALYTIEEYEKTSNGYHRPIVEDRVITDQEAEVVAELGLGV